MSDERMALWRVGSKVGRTIYAMVGDKPSPADELIGVMDTRELAVATVRGHNRYLEQEYGKQIASGEGVDE